MQSRRHPLSQSADQPTARDPLAKVLCIIVAYNSGDHVGDLLSTLERAAPGLRMSVVVVDNASHDDTVAIASGHPLAPRVVHAGGNLGYSGGINVGRALAEPGQVVAILNPDLQLSPRSLTELVNAVQAPGVGVTVPTIVRPDGEHPPHLRREPTVLGAFGDALFGSHLSGRPRFLSEFLRRDEDYSHPHDVDWASGALFVIAPACNHVVGPWDSDRFFLYAEETDYARRVRDAGFSVRFIPQAVATHQEGGSGTSPQLLALMSVNRIRYYEGHHGRAASFGYRAAVATQHLLRVSRRDHRVALGFVLSRSQWSRLPHGDLPRHELR